MGWWWSGPDDSPKKDAVAKLDPSLRDFLETEPSTEYTPKPAPEAPKSTPPRTSQTQGSTEKPPSSATLPPQVPRESLFQDGRYAHLWKNYQPQSVIESKGKTDQEKLADIVDAYNDKRASVSKAAQENCAFERLDLQDCYYRGSWGSRMALCHAENRKVQRCIEMQGKFLRALGYMAKTEGPVDEAEKTQIHADRLFRYMLQQEEIIAEAKKEGRPAPEFEPLMSKENLAAVMKGKPLVAREKKTQTSTDTSEFSDEFWANVPKSTRASYEKRLANLTPIEREIEKKSIEGEMQVNSVVKKQLEAAFVEERIHRMQRREAGRETIGDTLKRWWGWQ